MLEIGTKAPAFSLLNESGDSVTLENFAGKRVLLWFYPKADTPG